ncbi:MAG: 2-C-methyl-D-erythritol 4-phosphate cytidylyltransferase [Nocardiopsaceae bacterium]|jgi:2-C-methyl-D-erythritol 4-phosphate cytidylyltransferase|nr:2-C-methyl-D-erythritol 4-phosphate cytidylyltransferase [Nocardiopsaceae bacterium]
MRTVAVVLAGGSGVRLGGETPKQLQLLAGRTLLEHCVAAFDAAPGVDEVLVVMPADLIETARRVLDGGGYRKLTDVIAGGVDRPGSTSRAIGYLSKERDGAASAECNVLFHDAARPLVDQRIIADCVAALASAQALGVVVPTADTIVEVTDGVMTSIPPRESLARCQTPQGFRLSVIRRAHELAAADPGAAAFTPTDDCGIVLRYLPDVPVVVVAGSERNLKITYPGDFQIAELLIAEKNRAKPDET